MDRYERIQEESQMIISDIYNYLYGANEEGVTTQSEIGMKYLFRGWITKHWINITDNQKFFFFKN